jgi:hypothetical protein
VRQPQPGAPQVPPARQPPPQRRVHPGRVGATGSLLHPSPCGPQTLCPSLRPGPTLRRRPRPLRLHRPCRCPPCSCCRPRWCRPCPVGGARALGSVGGVGAAPLWAPGQGPGMLLLLLLLLLLLHHRPPTACPGGPAPPQHPLKGLLPSQVPPATAAPQVAPVAWSTPHSRRVLVLVPVLVLPLVHPGPVPAVRVWDPVGKGVRVQVAVVTLAVVVAAPRLPLAPGLRRVWAPPQAPALAVMVQASAGTGAGRPLSLALEPPLLVTATQRVRRRRRRGTQLGRVAHGAVGVAPSARAWPGWTA